MKLENQVVSLELSKRLKELGVKAKCLFFYNAANNLIFVSDNDGMEIIHSEYTPAFTVAELGETMKPWACKNWQQLPRVSATGERWETYIAGEWILASTEANARAKMLIYLLENNLIHHVSHK